MRTADIYGEAYRNIRSGAAAKNVFIWISLMLLALFTCSDIFQVYTIEKAAAQYLSSGAATHIITAENNISGTACKALTNVANITAAGALKAEEHKITLAALPNSGIPTFTTTAGFETVLGAAKAKPGSIVLSQEAFNASGASEHSKNSVFNLALVNNQIAQVGAVYEYTDDGRNSKLAYAALVPQAANQEFDECWITVWPQNEQSVQMLYTTVQKQDGLDQQISISKLNNTKGDNFLAQTKFQQRLTAKTPVLTAASGFFLGIIFVWRRRLEFASNLHAGAKKPQLLLITAIEITAIALFAILSTLLLCITLSYTLGSDPISYLALSLRTLSPFLPTMLLASILTVLKINEKNLFAFFKER